MSEELFDVAKIKSLLPHRYPFLLVDRVLDVNLDTNTILGFKNLTANEELFNGHFPDTPVMPGVLILEALAQVSGILGLQMIGGERAKTVVYYYAGIDGARFKKPVVPGDRLMLKSQYLSDKRGIWKFACEASVEGELVCKAEIMCAER